MIRINLLPLRTAKKQESVARQIVILVSGLVLVIAIALALLFMQNRKIAELKQNIASNKAMITQLDKKIGKINNLTKLRDQVKNKLDILAQLRKNKTGPASRMSELSDITPGQLWLDAYREAGVNIKIGGLAFNEELIAQFIRALEESPEFENVELVVSEQKEVADTKLKRFDLNARIETAKPAQAADKKTKKSK
ncbi:MAG: PilN domain-containing protein [Trichlorobacter sp.]|nr:PilN domain-containing protein [Trichlorobacter sp.]